MIATVYRFRDDNSRQTSNCYKVYETPQQFTRPEYPDEVQPDAPVQEVFSDLPVEKTPAAIVKLPEKVAACIKETSERPIRKETVVTSNYPIEKETVADKLVTAKQHVHKHALTDNDHYSPASLLFYFFTAKYDTPDRVTVTPQGTIPEMKVTDNLRNMSIFSKLTKWYKERHRKKDAGLRCCPAQNE